MSDETTATAKVEAAPETTPPVIAKVIPINAKAAEAQAHKVTGKRRKRKTVEQIAVECAAGHDDLKDRAGILTVDYVDGKPYDATFDPFDESIPNAVIPVETFTRSDAAITLTSCDEESWAFTIEADEDCGEP